MNNEILEDIRRLIKENILPRLTNLEIEVQTLRRVTWPVTQAYLESNQFWDASTLRKDFLSSVDPEEAKLLLNLKRRMYPD